MEQKLICSCGSVGFEVFADRFNCLKCGQGVKIKSYIRINDMNCYLDNLNKGKEKGAIG